MRVARRRLTCGGAPPTLHAGVPANRRSAMQTAAQVRPVSDRADWKRLHCSFCGKDADHVRFLAAGVFGGMICDRCSLAALLIFVKARIASTFRAAAA
ncbi:MAG: hypothetical protein DMF78_20530 [Acidobacteria bacterium]|nr:MAG: hypothetical protein DMF78_20530 [Acidobacteriota bacterium]